MAITGTLRAVVRAIVGLPADPGAPPDLLRLGLYPARVDVCAADGSKMDVTPADGRISPAKNCRVRVGIAGATAEVLPGCVVLLGWERGDPGKPYCLPIWDIGSTVRRLTLEAQLLELAGNAHPLPKWDAFLSDFSQLLTGLNTFTAQALLKVNLTAAVTTMNAAIGSGAYSSTKVKNG